MRKIVALLLGALVCLPTVARAEKERKSPLTDAPVIRKRLELRDKRFEAGVRSRRVQHDAGLEEFVQQRCVCEAS